jgi:hypothetical protein
VSTPEVEARPQLVGAIYGQILATAVVTTLSEDVAASASEIFFGVAVAMAVFWLAHVYAEAVALRLGREQPLTVSEVWAIGVREWPIIQAAAPALVALALGWFGVLPDRDCEDLAIGFGILALFGWGLVIALRSHMSFWGTVGAVLLNGAFGVAIVALKVVVH